LLGAAAAPECDVRGDNGVITRSICPGNNGFGDTGRKLSRISAT